jgi:putative endopeptidase
VRTPHLLIALFAVSCATAPRSPGSSDAAPPDAGPPAAAKKPMPPGLDESAMDPTTDPCTDFYQYACGGWMAATRIPEDQALFSRGFMSITQANELKLKAIGEDAAQGRLREGTPFAKQLGDYYGSCVDEPKLEDGASQLKRLLDGYKLESQKELPATLGGFHRVGWYPFFDIDSIQDFKKSTEMIGGLDQAGLGLPDRDYYLRDDEGTRKVRGHYLDYMKAMFALWGLEPELVPKVMELETRLARAQQTQLERRTPGNLDHRVDRPGVKKLAPAFNWDVYFDKLGAPSLTALNVNSETYFKELNLVFKELKGPALRAYLTWVALRSSVIALPRAFQAERFKYESAALTGATVDRPRWKKCVALADLDLPQVIGREFVRRHFGEAGKKTTLAMTRAIQAELDRDFDTLPWMDEPTKKAARSKLERMTANNKIGFPDVWRDYSGLTTQPANFLSNRLAARSFEIKRRLARVGKPIDRADWFTTPATVNAYNEPQMNEIVFPAGILQPPFFNAAATDAVNFGAMGMVVGHEITHGFDDEGRQYDENGNLRDWWSEASGKAFVERAACVKRQFDGYIAIDDLHVKGDLTLGENVADLGGLKLSHAAMTTWTKEKGTPGDYRFTPSQQFFLGYAQSWCFKARPETARLRAQTDPHAPAYWRVNGPLGNLDAFRTAFACRESAPVIRKGPERCEVW